MHIILISPIYVLFPTSVDCPINALRIAQAKFPNPPKRLPTLLRFLQHKGLSTVDPAERAGLNPFLVPLVKVRY